ncbi:MAG: LuxR C-terminal-related transcriptional regulator [Rhodobacteraceae bacterium]|nr:LuxR C-terminal-related transcriptional regulator [Paracoccaceae bacterium]
MTEKLIIFAVALELIALSLFGIEFFGSIFGISSLEVSWNVHEIIELSSITGLLLGAILSLVLLRISLRRNRRIEEQLGYASSSFHELLVAKFEEWKLSKAEAEIALLIVKGFSVAEIAKLRGKSEGTVKAQNTAIYQKSGLSGRVQLVSYFIEELTQGF